jgi:hypothetical protein
MTWQQVNWPLALLIYLGLLALFAVIVYCTYLPIRLMQVPAARKLYFRWLLVLWSVSFLVGFVLPTCTLFRILSNWSITDPAMTALPLMALVFMVYFPWMFQRMRASPSESASAGSREKGG